MQRFLAISLVALPILYWYKMSRRSRALGLRSVFECLPKSWSSRLCIGIVISGLYYIFWVWYNDPLRQLTLGYGQGDQGKVAVDVSDRFGTEDAFGVRFNAAYQDGDSAIDDESSTLGLAALGLDYKGEQYRLSADLGWQDNKLKETRPSVNL